MAYNSKIPNKALEKRIRKSGEVTDEDVQEYINQVGMDTLQSMNMSVDNVKGYLKTVVELGTTEKKKKLPKKKKIERGDSVVVADQNGNFSAVEQNEKEEKIKERAKNFVEGSIDLGNKAFNKMFPGIGKLMGWVQNKLDKQAKIGSETNSSIESYSRQTDRSSKLLDSIAESQSRSNNTLRQILSVVSASRTQQQLPANNGGGSIRNSAMNAAAGAAGAAAAAALGATTNQSTPPPSSEPPAPAPAPPPSATVVPPQPAPTPSTTATPVSRPEPSAINTPTESVGTPTPRSIVNEPAEAVVAPVNRQQIFNIQAFRAADSQGADEFENFVRTRSREIERQLNTSIPRNINRTTANERREANKAQAVSMATSEAQQRFAQRIQRTQTPAVSAPSSPAEAVGTPTVRQSTNDPAEAVGAPASPTATANRVETTNNDARVLNIKAREIVFKADKFEYPQAAIQTAASTPMGGGSSSSSAAPSASVSSGGSTGTATQTATGNISGLEFASGVDQRIGSAVANKTKDVQSAFGKKLLITSGFRDPGRNAKAGGAEASKHLTGDAVDVQFQGNEQDTINLIKAASEKGVGGIGVYRPGFVHLDVGSKRVWGPDYRAGSIPQWAQGALNEHMGRTTPGSATQSGGGGSQPALTPIASPAASRTPSTPSSGAAISKASIADETAGRPTAPLGMASRDSAGAPISNAPQQPSATSIDPNNPGLVEPPDAALRYARLFNMAA